MDSFQKIELIVKGRLQERRNQLDWCKGAELYGHSNLHVLGLEHEVSMLIRIAGDIDAIKRNHLSVRDEMVLKMYGSEK